MVKMNKNKDNIKYAHLLVEKQNKDIIYTVYDLCGALKVSKSKEIIKNYIDMFHIKIVDITHINYNCNYANIPAF